MIASKLLRLAAAAASTAVASCFASPVICRGARSTAPVSNSMAMPAAPAGITAAADMVFSPPRALHQQSQDASAARLGRLVAAASIGRPLGRFHMLTSRPAMASSSTEDSLFTRGGGLEEGGLPRAREENDQGEEKQEGEGGGSDANALPAGGCSDGADLSLPESDPQVWEIVSAERRRQVGGRMSDAPWGGCSLEDGKF